MYSTHLLVLTWATRPASSVCNKYNIIQYNISIILYNIAPVGLDLGDEARQLRKQRPDHAVEGLRVCVCGCARARACVWVRVYFALCPLYTRIASYAVGELRARERVWGGEKRAWERLCVFKCERERWGGREKRR